jgi:hypothetical protein
MHLGDFLPIYSLSFYSLPKNTYNLYLILYFQAFIYPPDM